MGPKNVGKGGHVTRLEILIRVSPSFVVAYGVGVGVGIMVPGGAIRTYPHFIE